jgi:hypothetical protein
MRDYILVLKYENDAMNIAVFMHMWLGEAATRLPSCLPSDGQLPHW